MGSPAGGQVAGVLISPTAIPGFNDTTAYSHYSLLKTILTAWNLPNLGLDLTKFHPNDHSPLDRSTWTGYNQ